MGIHNFDRLNKRLPPLFRNSHKGVRFWIHYVLAMIFDFQTINAKLQRIRWLCHVIRIVCFVFLKISGLGFKSWPYVFVCQHHGDLQGAIDDRNSSNKYVSAVFFNKRQPFKLTPPKNDSTGTWTICNFFQTCFFKPIFL